MIFYKFFSVIQFSLSFQGEQATKGHEVVSLRNEVRELRLELEQKNKDAAALRTAADKGKKYKMEIEDLNIQLDELRGKLDLVRFFFATVVNVIILAKTIFRFFKRYM